MNELPYKEKIEIEIERIVREFKNSDYGQASQTVKRILPENKKHHSERFHSENEEIKVISDQHTNSFHKIRYRKKLGSTLRYYEWMISFTSKILSIYNQWIFQISIPPSFYFVISYAKLLNWVKIEGEWRLSLKLRRFLLFPILFKRKSLNSTLPRTFEAFLSTNYHGVQWQYSREKINLVRCERRKHQLDLEIVD